MSDNSPCPKCNSEFAYSTGGELMMCPECGHEWNPADAIQEPVEVAIVDANGTPLTDGDSVIVLKNLPVKGMPQPVKAGTKVKNIRLTEGDHNIACKDRWIWLYGIKI